MRKLKFARKKSPGSEAGQAMVFALLGMGLFLIGAMGFAIDMGSLWFSRQAAQTASDAACIAGAMDMLVGETNGAIPANANFPTPFGTGFSCDSTGSPTSSPCQYAALNGFNSSLTSKSASSGTSGNNVSISFPATSSYTNFTNFPPSSDFLGGNVLIQATVTDNIPTFFAGLLRGKTSQTITASSLCGVIQATSPIPILVLNPTVSGSLSMSGGGSVKSTGDIAIAGGPSKSIQVNSSSTTAVSTNGGPTIDLCSGGNTYCGSNMGVWGNNSTPSGFWNTVAKCTSVNTLCTTGTQTAPQFNSPSAPIADPLASTSAPADMGFNGTMNSTTSADTANGCFDASGCDEYGPGDYTSSTGITVKGRTAIFAPGIYYVKNGLSADSNSCLLPSFAIGDGSGGVVFYFADNSSVSVSANSGKSGHGCPATAYNGVAGSFNTLAGPSGTPFANGVKCKSSSTIPGNLPSSLSGSVLLAPCQAPTVKGLCGPNCSINPGTNGGGGFGDPLGTGDPDGEQRGILFFQDRGVSLGKKNQPSWGGGGSMLLAGTMYFHDCVTTGTDTGQGCDTTNGFTDQFSLGGTPSSSTYVLGDIIVDELSLSGNSGLTMDLNPSAARVTLKAALLQ